MPVLPLGLACVAAAAESRGHTVKMLNLMVPSDPHAAIDKAFQDFNPEIVGISVRNIDDQNMENPQFLLEPVQEVVTACRRHSSAPIVLGGAGYSIFPRAVLDFLRADIGIQGEGEGAFLTLLKRLHERKDISTIPGLYLPGRPQGQKPACPKRLTALPMPLAGGGLSALGLHPDEEIWMPVQTRRGCPLDCIYCSTAEVEGRIIRQRDPSEVVDSIGSYAADGWDRFFFVDNTFNLPNSYARNLCKRIAAAGLKIRWRCILYPWKVDEVLAETMAAAGCGDVSLGFESGSDKMLATMNKRYRTAEVRRVSAALEKFGIGRMGFLLLGGPGETRQTVLESLHFADSLGLEAMKITVGIRIYPRTRLARIAAKEGLIQADDDLLHPKFYLAKGLQGWLQETLKAWRETRPHWRF
jgi:radical SAM superfamily enzyme YgiQ (UPF0313 family)